MSYPLIAGTQETKLDTNPDLIKAIDALKSDMIPTSHLRIPDHDQPFILERDASIVARGAVLRQVEPGESFRIAFFSIGLSNPEWNSSTYAGETRVIVKSVKFCRVFS